MERVYVINEIDGSGSSNQFLIPYVTRSHEQANNYYEQKRKKFEESHMAEIKAGVWKIVRDNKVLNSGDFYYEHVNGINSYRLVKDYVAIN